MNIITWNMQGATGFRESKWVTDIPRLFAAGAQVLCLQECGNLPPGGFDNDMLPWLAGPGAYNARYVTVNYGTSDRLALVNILWVETDPNGHRVNLAIAFDPSAFTATSAILLANPAGGNSRPAVGLRFPVPAGALDLYTIHAQSPGGADGPGLINAIVGTGGTFFSAGDYNALPTAWAGNTPAGAVLCPNTGDNTHPGSGTNLDYAFRNAARGPVTGTVWNTFVVSDHYPVAYSI